jgi:hypothetical protein
MRDVVLCHGYSTDLTNNFFFCKVHIKLTIAVSFERRVCVCDTCVCLCV